MTLSQADPKSPDSELEEGELESSDNETPEGEGAEQDGGGFNINDMLDQIAGRGKTPSPSKSEIPQGYVPQHHGMFIGDNFHQQQEEVRVAVGPEIRHFTDFTSICPPALVRRVSNEYQPDHQHISPIKRGLENNSPQKFIKPPEKNAGLLPTPTFNGPAIPIGSPNPLQRGFHITRRVLMPYPPRGFRGGQITPGSNVLHRLNSNSVHIRGQQQRGGTMSVRSTLQGANPVPLPDGAPILIDILVSMLEARDPELAFRWAMACRRMNNFIQKCVDEAAATATKEGRAKIYEALHGKPKKRGQDMTDDERREANKLAQRDRRRRAKAIRMKYLDSDDDFVVKKPYLNGGVTFIGAPRKLFARIDSNDVMSIGKVLRPIKKPVLKKDEPQDNGDNDEEDQIMELKI